MSTWRDLHARNPKRGKIETWFFYAGWLGYGYGPAKWIAARLRARRLSRV